MSISRKVALAASVTAAIAATAGPTTAAAQRNYEVEVCSSGGGYDGATANVAAYNQDNKYTHTPNFRISDDSLGCGYQPHYWFKPNQVVTINARMLEGDWRRYYRNLAKCQIDSSHPSARMCYIT